MDDFEREVFGCYGEECTGGLQYIGLMVAEVLKQCCSCSDE